jgi:hypothetical protein
LPQPGQSTLIAARVTASESARYRNDPNQGEDPGQAVDRVAALLVSWRLGHRSHTDDCGPHLGHFSQSCAADHTGIGSGQVLLLLVTLWGRHPEHIPSSNRWFLSAWARACRPRRRRFADHTWIGSGFFCPVGAAGGFKSDLTPCRMEGLPYLVSPCCAEPRPALPCPAAPCPGQQKAVAGLKGLRSGT